MDPSSSAGIRSLTQPVGNGRKGLAIPIGLELDVLPCNSDMHLLSVGHLLKSIGKL